MKKFNELSYDQQWLLFFVHSRKEIKFKDNPKQKAGVDEGMLWGFDEYFNDFCNATKRGMDFNDFDKKMTELSKIADKFIDEGIFVGTPKPSNRVPGTIKMSKKGEAYFELEVKNKILDILPKINFPEAYHSQVEDYKIKHSLNLEQQNLMKNTISRAKSAFTNIGTISNLTQFSQTIIENPDITKVLIKFVGYLIGFDIDLNLD